MNNRNYFKKIIVIILFWLIVVVLPIKIFSFFSDNGSLLIDYLVVAPILIFILLYNFIKITDKKSKIIFIIMGFLVPYLFLLFYIYQGIIGGINPKIL